MGECRSFGKSGHAMRVIAGSAGGIRLEVPREGVRPTMDRVKAAIFSSLADRIVEARVLDLFAGTGALGIEALSRGAASVLFVEQDRQSIRAIEKNLARAKLQGRVRQEDVFEFLAHPPVPIVSILSWLIRPTSRRVQVSATPRNC